MMQLASLIMYIMTRVIGKFGIIIHSNDEKIELFFFFFSFFNLVFYAQTNR